MINLNKHFLQIKKGGVIVVIKKLRSLFYLFLISPIYILAIPVVIILRLIRPWYLIRWHGLVASRIGHLAIDAELYFCRRDAKINQPSQKYIDIFFLGRKYVCNKQLVKMLRRSLTILPAFLLIPLFNTNRFLNLFIKGGSQHEIDINSKEGRDIHNILHKFKPHISFNEKEELKGKKILNEFGIPENAKFVCLIVRDSAYLDRYKNQTLRDFSYHNYRDGDIDKYLLAAEELTKRGYYVFRMGVKVHKPLKSSNIKIIDYANSKMRSDFMDIYLGANCRFCISTSCGFDSIPYIFRKPIAYVEQTLYNIRTEIKHDLILLHHHFNKENKKKLTMSEIFSINDGLLSTTKDYEKGNILLEENSPEEIKNLVIEMDERLENTWKENDKDLFLQKKFWTVFQNNIENNIENIDKTKYSDPKDNWKLFEINQVKKIKKIANFSASFLRDNEDWIQ